MGKKRIYLFALIVTLVTIFLSYGKIFYPLDMGTEDLLCQRPSVTNKNIYIIAIDDNTLKEYGDIRSWSRAIPAQLVEKLNQNENRPRAITFDVIYSEKSDEAGDAQFVKVCKEAGNVVMASSFSLKEKPEYDDKGKVYYNPHFVVDVVEPYEELKAVVHTGYANTITDEDGYVRRALGSLKYKNETFYSLAEETYMQYLRVGKSTPKLPKTDRFGQYYFQYSGKTGCYSVVSMVDVMDGTVDTRLFSDSIVFVGAYAAGMQDSYTPAISHGKQMYGVEIQASIVEALLEQRTQTEVPMLLFAIVLGAFAGIFFLALRRLSIIPSTIVFVALIIADFLLAILMYKKGFIIPAITGPILFFVIYVENLIEGYVQEILRRHRVVNVFKQYVAPQIVDKISKDKDFDIVLGGENRHIAVLFVDIRGFTTMSEAMEPEEIVEVLNEYLSLTTQSIFDNGGTLDKFVGDATMAVFNAPFDLEDYVYRAVKTACDMRAGADALAERIEKRFGKSVDFGIGVNCGNAVVGNIGCDFRMDYTAIGDTVNTAARLESNAKRGQILISEAVYETIKDRVKVTEMGAIPMKGKTKEILVYQVEDLI